MVEGGRFEIYFTGNRNGGSNPPLSATERCRSPLGEVTEWPKVHDWKSCVGQPTEGSNPSLSAIFKLADRHESRVP